jgi:hypothetical protein
MSSFQQQEQRRRSRRGLTGNIARAVTAQRSVTPPVVRRPVANTRMHAVQLSTSRQPVWATVCGARRIAHIDLQSALDDARLTDVLAQDHGDACRGHHAEQVPWVTTRQAMFTSYAKWLVSQ